MWILPLNKIKQKQLKSFIGYAYGFQMVYTKHSTYLTAYWFAMLILIIAITLNIKLTKHFEKLKERESFLFLAATRERVNHFYECWNHFLSPFVSVTHNVFLFILMRERGREKEKKHLESKEWKTTESVLKLATDVFMYLLCEEILNHFTYVKKEWWNGIEWVVEIKRKSPRKF